MYILLRFWQKISPHYLLVFIRFLLEPKILKQRRVKVLEHFKNVDPKTTNPIILEGLKYLKHHKFSAFPYYWTQKYDNLLPVVYRDLKHHRFYILFEGKRMYFPEKYTKTHVIWAVRSIYKEQDLHSPHLYLTDDFQVENNSIIVDAGVAEGNFALSVVEKAKKLYLIESNHEWMDTLKLTFEPWKEKVFFVEKYLSDIESNTTSSIDALLNPDFEETYFIKMDIEGFEQKALSGMRNLVKSGSSIKMNVCTYHHPKDFVEINTILSNYGFKWHVSEGYVLFFQQGEVPSFRKVLIRAKKS